jgi:uncharacterized membrane protein YeiH
MSWLAQASLLTSDLGAAALDKAFISGLTQLGLVVFALSGAFVAARRRMDPVGFILLAVVTGVGGGAVRDALLSIQAGWVADPQPLALCMGVGLGTFLAGRIFPRLLPWLERRRALAWADAAGLAIFAVTGADRALGAGAHWLTATALGAATASFGGVIRDILAGERPLFLHREIYVTAAALGAGVYVGAVSFGAPEPLAVGAAVLVGFGLRAAAIQRGWSLPAYAPPDAGPDAA